MSETLGQTGTPENASDDQKEYDESEDAALRRELDLRPAHYPAYGRIPANARVLGGAGSARRRSTSTRWTPTTHWMPSTGSGSAHGRGEPVFGQQHCAWCESTQSRPHCDYRAASGAGWASATSHQRGHAQVRREPRAGLRRRVPAPHGHRRTRAGHRTQLVRRNR